MTKTASKSFSLSNSSQTPFFAVLMYALYGHPRYFKFKRKYQQFPDYLSVSYNYELHKQLSSINSIVDIKEDRCLNEGN